MSGYDCDLLIALDIRYASPVLSRVLPAQFEAVNLFKKCSTTNTSGIISLLSSVSLQRHKT